MENISGYDGLFTDAVSWPDVVPSNDRMINGLERIGKEPVVA
jgi:hypothetical protein